MSLPQPPDNTIARPRLVERLERGMAYPLTLVAAPAGSGKTSLLVEWAARQARPLAWLSLDEGDRDTTRAQVRLAASLQSLRPGLVASPAPGAEQALVALLNELAQVPVDVAVVLDNYHAIEGSPLDEAAGRLLDYLPPQVHLVLAGRHRPIWPLGRLRVRGQLLEIGGLEFRFSAEETAALLQVTLGRAAPGQAAALLACSEGWALGLQRGLEATRGCADWRRALAALSGRDPILARYFEDEVLRREPERLRAFLLQTSVLGRLQAPLCDALTARQDGQAALEELERRNLFTVPLDGERHRYRYHTLFAGFLQDALERSQPELAAELRRRAAAWADPDPSSSWAGTRLA